MGGPLLTDTEKLATINAVTLADIKNHHKKTHTTANMRFCLVGNFAAHREKIVNDLESWPLPRGEELPVIPEKLHAVKPRRIFRKDTPGIDMILHIALNRKFTLSEMIAMHRLNHILTGSFHSRMFGAARTRGLSYGLYSGTDTAIEGVTRWEIGGTVSEKNAVDLYALIADQLKKVSEGDIGTSELDDAKLYALGDYQFKGQRVYDLSRWYAFDFFEDLTIDPIDELPHHIERVTIQQMATLAKEFIEKGEWTVGAIGTISAPVLNKVHKELSSIFTTKVQ